MSLKQFPGDDEEDEESELIGPGCRGLGQIQRDEHMSSPRRATLTGNRGIRQSSNRLGDHEISWIIAAKIQGESTEIIQNMWLGLSEQITKDLNNGKPCIVDGKTIATPTQVGISEGITAEEVFKKFTP